MDTVSRLVLALIFLTAYLSCEHKETNPDTHDLLKGEWQWVNTSGGLAGQVRTPSSTGERSTLIFTSNKTYQIFTNGQLSGQGAYRISQGTCIHDQTRKSKIIFSSGLEMGIEYLDDETLYLAQEVTDGNGSEYKRVGAALPVAEAR